MPSGNIEHIIEEEQVSKLHVAALVTSADPSHEESWRARRRAMVAECSVGRASADNQPPMNQLPAEPLRQDNLRFSGEPFCYMLNTVSVTRETASRVSQVPDLPWPLRIRKKSFDDIPPDAYGAYNMSQKCVRFSDVVTFTPIRLEDHISKNPSTWSHTIDPSNMSYMLNSPESAYLLPLRQQPYQEGINNSLQVAANEFKK